MLHHCEQRTNKESNALLTQKIGIYVLPYLSYSIVRYVWYSRSHRSSYLWYDTILSLAREVVTRPCFYLAYEIHSPREIVREDLHMALA